MEDSRPLDALNKARNKRVIVELKNGKQYAGKLNAFDIHINIVLEEAEESEEEEKSEDDTEEEKTVYSFLTKKILCPFINKKRL